MEEFLVNGIPGHTGETESDLGSPNPDNDDSAHQGFGKGGRHHFTPEEDMSLLRLIVTKNPFGARGHRGAVWEDIEAELRALGYDCTIKSCQDRLARLLRTLASEEMMKKSICGQQIQGNPEMGELLEEITRLKGPVFTEKNEAKARKVSVARSMSEVVENGFVAAAKRSFGAAMETTQENGVFQYPQKLQRAFIETPDLSHYHNQKLALMREELALRRKSLECREAATIRAAQAEEAKNKRETELQELRLKLEADKMELDRQRLMLERDKHDMERRRQDMEISERTQHLETMRQQQTVLFQLLTKTLKDQSETKISKEPSDGSGA